MSTLTKGDNMDSTENIRRQMSEKINAAQSGRAALEAAHGQVWDTEQLQAEFEITGFLAPFVGVTRKADGKVGSMMFVHWPRHYWGFKEG